MFGQLGISGTDLTSFDQDQTSHPMWRNEIGLQHDADAHTVSNQDRGWQLQGVQQGTDVITVRLDVAMVRTACGGAMSAQIAGDHTMP